LAVPGRPEGAIPSHRFPNDLQVDIGEEATPARKPRGTTAATHSKQAASGGMFGDLTTIKHLVDRLGAEPVRKIVGLFE
jgi:hypothetical protein